MAVQFASFPTEIVSTVAGQLQSSDLCALRLICRELHNKTLHLLYRVDFTTLRMDLSVASLPRLKEISKHQDIPRYVQQLNIKKSALSMTRDNFGQGFHFSRKASGCLLAPIPRFELLRDVLVSKLIYCRSFHVGCDNLSEYQYRSDYLGISDCISILLTIVIQTCLSVRLFCIDNSDSNNYELDGNRFEDIQYRSLQFRNAWSSVQELVLIQNMKRETIYLMLELVLSTKDLRKLILSLQNDHPIWNEGNVGLEDKSISFMKQISLAESIC